jgi:hypothetical protein
MVKITEILADSPLPIQIGHILFLTTINVLYVFQKYYENRVDSFLFRISNRGEPKMKQKIFMVIMIITAFSFPLESNAQGKNSGVPQITDQMMCVTNMSGGDVLNETTTTSLICMKQSTKVQQIFSNMAEVFADGWVTMSISADGTSVGGTWYLFYK